MNATSPVAQTSRVAPPSVSRLVGWLAAPLAAFSLAACASVVPPAPAAAPETMKPRDSVRVEGSAGSRSARDSAQTLREAKAEGRGPQFENHLEILQQAGETLYAGNELALLVDGPATFDAIFAELEQARERVLLQTYIFEGTDIGRRIADVLLRKRAEGVDVRVIYDSVGSFATPAAFFDELREGGIEACEFNPVSPLRRATGILRVNNRDHRKLLAIDDRVAFTGGVNISSVYSSASFGSRASKLRSPEEDGWRDTHVRIEGPAVRRFIELFQDTWRRQACEGELAALPDIDPDSLKPPEQGERLVAVIESTAEEDSGRFRRAFLGAIEGATDSVHITMAYFVPDPGMLAALTRAAQRGVEVVLVLPGRSDSWLTLHAGQSHYDELLLAGVRIHEKRDALLHAKTAVIDGVWSTVGSSNLDWRSFVHNDEVNAVILGREFGAAMERLFAHDVEQAEAVDPDAWAQRPAGPRLKEWLARRFEYWL
ncbi:MAG: cardiolipin synthase B [Thauera phenolivorans]|uniref:Cardiolipin synthase B n=2 Tax=Thauera phenolivorans TaxID=1792543 RepID=A0A7X7LYP9_9RHOO|nr:cardiolipin synthase B [Thauera phenolivorans]